MVFQIGDPVGACEVGVVNENAEIDGIASGLSGVINFKSAAFGHWGREVFDGFLNDSVEHTGGDFGTGLCGDIVDGFNGTFHIIAAFSGNK